MPPVHTFLGEEAIQIMQTIEMSEICSDWIFQPKILFSDYTPAK